MPIFDAALLDTDPAGCELLRAMLDAGAEHRKRSLKPLNGAPRF
jgi:hypothetical protein